MTLPRRVLSTGTVGIVLVALGVLAGAGPAIGGQTTATTLGYTCQFPAGPQQVQLRVNATFPETDAVGAAIVPSDVSAKLVIPQVALGNLTTINAASVEAKADLSVVVRNNGDSQASTWRNLTAPNTPLPSTGDLTMTLSGIAAPVRESGSGDVTFAADAFGLLLTPSTSSGAATNPATMPVACTLNPGQTATLATVHIPATPTNSTPPTNPNKPSTSSKDAARPGDDTPKDPACNLPNGSESPVTGATPIEADLLGRTNLNKLGESTESDGIVYITNVDSWFGNDAPIFTLCYTGQLAMNPSTTTILGFGFVPITTTLKYVQANTPENPMWVDASSDFDTSTYPDGHPTGHSSALINIYVASASINGTPLNVGDNCRTKTPVSLVLNSLPELNPDNTETYPYAGAGGGYLQGSIDVPDFTGCGVEDNLDNLLSAPVAGPNNLIRVCQGTADVVDPPVPPTEDLNHCKAPQ